MPFYVSLVKIISNRRAPKTSITISLSIFSKNFYDFYRTLMTLKSLPHFW